VQLGAFDGSGAAMALGWAARIKAIDKIERQKGYPVHSYFTKQKGGAIPFSACSRFFSVKFPENILYSLQYAEAPGKANSGHKQPWRCTGKKLL
jgi:hypothetical protein